MNIQTQIFNSHSVRIVANNPLCPLFVARDVALALGYKNTNEAINKFCKGVVKRYPLETVGGVQEVRVIEEPDLYRLIFGSKLKSAIQFQDWVFEEVLPAIRKTGKYEIPTGTLTPDQQRHIQETVNRIWSRDGIHFQTTYNRIKTAFRVGTYKDVKQEKYPALCHFLGVEPVFKTAEPEQIDPGLADLLDFAADRVMLLARVEEKLNQQWREMEILREQIAEARYRTFDLIPHFRIASRKIRGVV